MSYQSTQKNIFIISAAVVVVAAIVIILSWGSINPTLNQAGSGALVGAGGVDPAVVEQHKLEIITMVNSGKVLTDKERSQIIEWLSGDKINAYLFSAEEKNSIIEALNKR